MNHSSSRGTLPRLGALALAPMFALVFALAFALITPRPAAAQDTPMKDGHPDLNGYWVPGPAGAGGGGTEQFERTADGSILFDFALDQGAVPLCLTDDCQASNQPPYNAEWMKKVKAIADTEFAGTTAMDPILSCKPAGIPRAGLGNVQIVQTPAVTAMVHADYTDRLIYTDGRTHPSDLEPSYMGDSIGHWEGNTLVVDVTGFNDDTWLGGGFEASKTVVGGFTKYTSVHSEKEHVTERWTRKGNEVTYEATIEDPVAFTKPWVIAPRKMHLAAPGDYLNTYFCDGSGISAFMRQHYVKPNPEDRDIRYKCGGHHCEVVPAPPAAKQK